MKGSQTVKISKEEVLAKIKMGDVVLLNVATAEEYRKLRIKGSLHQHYQDDPEAFSKKAEETFGKDKSFIVYADHFGNLQSFEATQALKQRGIKALNYAGGVQEWHKSGYPMEGTEIKKSEPEKKPAEA